MPKAEDMAQGDDQHQRIRAIEFLPHIATFHIKVFSDFGRPSSLVTTGDDKFIFLVSEDMHEHFLTAVEIFVTTVSSSGIVQVQIRNDVSGDMLTTPVQIDAGDLNSKDSGTPAVVPNDAIVNWGNHVAIDVDAAGTGARGLGVILEFML